MQRSELPIAFSLHTRAAHAPPLRARRDQLLPGEWDYGLFAARDLGPYLGMTADFMRDSFPDA